MHTKQKVHTRVVEASGSSCFPWGSALFPEGVVTVGWRLRGSVTASPAAGLETPQKGTAPEAPGMAQFSQIIQEEALASASRDTLGGDRLSTGSKGMECW